MKKLTKKDTYTIKGGAKNLIVDDIVISQYKSRDKGNIIIDDVIVWP